jgi:hypothetical protein
MVALALAYSGQTWRVRQKTKLRRYVVSTLLHKRGVSGLNLGHKTDSPD